MTSLKVTQNTQKWKYFIFFFFTSATNICTFRLFWVKFAPRWTFRPSSEAPNKENGCCRDSWSCTRRVCLDFLWDSGDRAHADPVVRTLCAPTFARFLQGQAPAGLWGNMKENSKQWNCKPASEWWYMRKRGQTEVRGRADTGTRSDLGGGAVGWLALLVAKVYR